MREVREGRGEPGKREAARGDSFKVMHLTYLALTMFVFVMFFIPNGRVSDWLCGQTRKVSLCTYEH